MRSTELPALQYPSPQLLHPPLFLWTVNFPQAKSPLKPLVNPNSQTPKGCHCLLHYPTGPFYPGSKEFSFFSLFLFFLKNPGHFYNSEYNNQSAVGRGSKREASERERESDWKGEIFELKRMDVWAKKDVYQLPTHHLAYDESVPEVNPNSTLILHLRM